MLVAWMILGSLTLFAILFFVVIPFAIGHVGGWTALGAEYRLNGRFEGTRWRFQDVRLRGWCGYNGCVSVGANAEGLYLNTIFIVSHPPLFFPWTDLSVARREVKFLGFRVGLVEFVAARVPGIHIALKETLLKRIAAIRGEFVPAHRETIVDSTPPTTSNSVMEPPETPR